MKLRWIKGTSFIFVMSTTTCVSNDSSKFLTYNITFFFFQFCDVDDDHPKTISQIWVLKM
jgi:hypothetical protein